MSISFEKINPLTRVVFLSDILPFVIEDTQDAITLRSVSKAWQDTLENYPQKSLEPLLKNNTNMRPCAQFEYYTFVASRENPERLQKIKEFFPELPRNPRKDTPLHWAAQEPKKRSSLAIHNIAGEGYDMNARDREQNTPLHVAILHTNIQAVEELLKHHADPNLPTQKNKTPLMIALEGGMKEDERTKQIVALLLQSGADPMKTDSQGNTVYNMMGSTLRGHRIGLGLLLPLLCYISNRKQYPDHSELVTISAKSQFMVCSVVNILYLDVLKSTGLQPTYELLNSHVSPFERTFNKVTDILPYLFLIHSAFEFRKEYLRFIKALS